MSNRRLIPIVLWCSFAVAFLVCMSTDYAYFSIDASIHAYNIQHWKYTGASDLIIAEGAILYRIFQAVGLHILPTAVLKIWWILSGISILGCAWLVLRKLAKYSAAAVWGILLMDAGLFMLLYLGYFTFWYRQDYNFMALAVLASTCILYLKSRGRAVRVVCWAVLGIVLIHIPYARNNALAILPVLTLAAIMFGTSIRSWRMRLLGAASATLCIYGFIQFLFPIGGKPHECMMISDMKIAAILNNEFEYRKSELAKVGYEIATCSGKNTIPLLCPEAFIGRDDDADSMKLEEMYKSEWRRIPEEMLMARVIQGVRFYCTGYAPRWFRSMVTWRYPEIKADNPVWEWGTDAGPDNLVAVYFRPLTYGISMVFFICYLMRYRRLTPIGEAAVYTAAISFTYLLSFCVAIPTHDHRYHTPILFGMFCFLSLVIADMLSKREKEGSKSLP